MACSWVRRQCDPAACRPPLPDSAPRPLCLGRLSPVSCLELSLLIPRMFQVFPPPSAHTPPCPSALPCLMSCLLLPCPSPSAPWRPALPHPGSRGLLPDPSPILPDPYSLLPDPCGLLALAAVCLPGRDPALGYLPILSRPGTDPAGASVMTLQVGSSAFLDSSLLYLLPVEHLDTDARRKKSAPLFPVGKTAGEQLAPSLRAGSV